MECKQARETVDENSGNAYHDSSSSRLKWSQYPSDSYTILRDDRERVATHRSSTYYVAEVHNDHCWAALAAPCEEVGLY